MSGEILFGAISRIIAGRREELEMLEGKNKRRMLTESGVVALHYSRDMLLDLEFIQLLAQATLGLCAESAPVDNLGGPQIGLGK